MRWKNPVQNTLKGSIQLFHTTNKTWLSLIRALSIQIWNKQCCKTSTESASLLNFNKISWMSILVYPIWNEHKAYMNSRPFEHNIQKKKFHLNFGWDFSWMHLGRRRGTPGTPPTCFPGRRSEATGSICHRRDTGRTEQTGRLSSAIWIITITKMNCPSTLTAHIYWP